MTKKTFTFYEDCWWDGEFPNYYYDTDDFIPNGSPHSVEECYERVVEHLGLEDQEYNNAINLIESLGYDVVIIPMEQHEQ